MDGRLLERDAELEVLVRAVDDAGEGRSSVVLLLGEAGIGKTSLVRTFVSEVADRARVLVGSCDDLLTPRTFGPLRDATVEHPGPLADALAATPTRKRSTRRCASSCGRADDPPCSSSRTCTGPTTRPWTRCATSAGG